MASLKRLAVVVPPEEWFRGWPLYAYYETYRRALADLGVETIDVPMRVFLQPLDLARHADMLGEVRDFQPQAAIALHIGTFLVHCRLPPNRDGWRPHFLAELLDLPSIAIWDAAPFDLAVTFLDGGTQASPEASRPGALADLRRAFCHPRLIHWSRDSGQSRLMAELGLLNQGQLVSERSPTFPDFMRPPVPGSADGGVCFVGYLQQDLPAWSDPVLNDVARDVVEQWVAQDGQRPWDLLIQRIAALAPAERTRLALDPDQSFFWAFASRVLGNQAHTARRLQVLGAVGRPVTVYGNLDPAGAPANLTSVPGYVPPGAPLADLFARHAITIDVLNTHFLNGYGSKAMLCFSAGGFMLMDRKRDFIEAFGEVGEAVSYGSTEELAAKVDLYLSRPRLRAELGAAMREQIAARHTLHATLERGLARAAEIGARPVPPPVARSVARIDLLTALHRWGKWPWQRRPLPRTAAGVEVSSTAMDGAFAARLVLPAGVTSMRQPHLRLTLRTVAGRLGIGVRHGRETMLDLEQHVGPSRHDVTFDFELPEQQKPEVIWRQTSDVPLHVVVSELKLCDRP